MPNVKTRKNYGFTVCSQCELYRSQLGEVSITSTKVEFIKAAQKDHLDKVRRERSSYYSRRDQAISQPNHYCSLIVDGADQKAYGLLHFVFNSKDDRGHKLKVKVVAALEHGRQKKLNFYLMTEEFETGSNHIIEAIHRTLDAKYLEEGKLPANLYLQLDNCTRENKNRYLFSYLEILVKIGVFLTVQVSFLPIGHTNEDIDEAFSVAARHLKHSAAHTLAQLIHEINNAYTTNVGVTYMKNFINYTGLCEK